MPWTLERGVCLEICRFSQPSPIAHRLPVANSLESDAAWKITYIETNILMKTAYYMNVLKGHNGSLERVGGLPSHLPPSFPICPDTDQPMAFLLQIYCHPVRLPVPGALCLQLYQCRSVDNGDDPTPVLVRVPMGARENIQAQGSISPLLEPHDIIWEVKEDPDEMPSSSPVEGGKYYRSKLGGVPTFESCLKGRRFLGQIAESPMGFNFGGVMAILMLDSNSNPILEMC